MAAIRCYAQVYVSMCFKSAVETDVRAIVCRSDASESVNVDQEIQAQSADAVASL